MRFILLLTVVLATFGCINSETSYCGKIVKIRNTGSLTAVTLDILANSTRSFGAIGHGEILIADADREKLKALMGKMVTITGSCNGWTCKNTTILETPQ